VRRVLLLPWSLVHAAAAAAASHPLQAHPDIQIKAHRASLQEVQELVLWVLGAGSASKFAMVQVGTADTAVLQANCLSSSS
jgi:hypothetical protein